MKNSTFFFVFWINFSVNPQGSLGVSVSFYTLYSITNITSEDFGENKCDNYFVASCIIFISSAKSAIKALIKCVLVAPAHRLIPDKRVKAGMKCMFIIVGNSL